MGDAFVDVGDGEGDVDDAVAVGAVVLDQRTLGVDGAFDDEADGTGFEDETVVVAVAGGGSGVGDQGHPECGLEVVGGLGGVADHPDDGVPAADRERVAGAVVFDEPDQLFELAEVETCQAFLVGESLLDRHDGAFPCNGFRMPGR
ncbi:hypothetical protein R1CP_06730 [Rhodococcus opacus]|uniref:Uncharacterized protein n=1 Tax=Rhodococcus opacus TaxID=37919 RepID=A0A1B1K0D7_RHOOP|nr:hypothetical protein R1CP_06730 [Rhodococcus opacus]